MNRANLYYGLTKIAWAFVLLHVNFNLNTLNLLPDWAGYLLIAQAIPLLAEERRDLLLLKPFCLVLGLWSAADWLLALFGASLSGRLLPLDVVVGVVSLYFSFQLLTDLAALAERFQGEGWALDKNLRFCRSLTTVLSTLFLLPLPWARDGWSIAAMALLLLNMVVSLLVLYYLFSLRKRLYEEEGGEA